MFELVDCPSRVTFRDRLSVDRVRDLTRICGDLGASIEVVPDDFAGTDAYISPPPFEGVDKWRGWMADLEHALAKTLDGAIQRSPEGGVLSCGPEIRDDLVRVGLFTLSRLRDPYRRMMAELCSDLRPSGVWRLAWPPHSGSVVQPDGGYFVEVVSVTPVASSQQAATWGSDLRRMVLLAFAQDLCEGDHGVIVHVFTKRQYINARAHWAQLLLAASDELFV